MNDKPKVLLVEDDKFTGRMMELQFSKSDYQLTLVDSGSAALIWLAQNSVDLVLTDLIMPGMSGVELVREIRKTRSRDELPVIVLSGQHDNETFMEVLQAGADDFMTKTNEFALIQARLNLHFDARRGRARAQEVDAKPRGSDDLDHVRVPEDGLWSWNLASGEIYFSTRWKAILGFRNDELPNDEDSWFGRIFDKDLERVQDALDRHKNRTSPWFEVNYRIRRRNDKYIWVHSFAAATFDKAGNPRKMVGCMNEIRDAARIKKRHKRLQDGLEDFALEIEAVSNILVGESAAVKAMSGLNKRFQNLLEEARRPIL